LHDTTQVKVNERFEKNEEEARRLDKKIDDEKAERLK